MSKYRKGEIKTDLDYKDHDTQVVITLARAIVEEAENYPSNFDDLIYHIGILSSHIKDLTKWRIRKDDSEELEELDEDDI